MPHIKYKQFKATLLLALVMVAGLLFIALPNVLADPVPDCPGSATLVRPTNGDAPYCKCPKGQVLVTTPTNSCQANCPDGTVATTQNGQTDCNEQLQCPDGTNAPNNNVNQCDSTADPAEQCSKGNCDLIKKYINPAINLLSALVGLVVVGSVIAGAIQYSASEGDPQKAVKAKDRIMNSIVALVAFIFLFAFLQWLIPGGILNK